MSVTMVSKVLCISYIMDLNVLCVSCVVVAMARTTRKGGWDVGDNDVNGGWLWIPNVMVLDQRGRIGDCPAVGRCLRRARRIIPTSCLLNTCLSSTFFR
jgi:hypothetical protein